MPLGYAETMLFGTVALLFAERIRRDGHTGFRTFAFGLVGGLGLWNSILSLAFLLPAFLWLPWRSGRLGMNIRFLALMFAGLLVGASPWIAYNVIYPFASFRSNF